MSSRRHETTERAEHLRIVQVVTVVDPDFSWGGPLTVALSQARALRERGHDVVLAGGWRGTGKAPTVVDDVPARLFRTVSAVPPLRFSGLVAPQLPPWLIRRRKQLDVVHLHFARDLVPLSAAATLRSVGTPFVTQTHGMVVADDRPVTRALDRVATVPLLRRAHTRFVLTDREQQDLASVVGATGPAEVLPNGVDLRPGAPGEPTATPDVLFLARLHPRKRVMLFARAAERLRQTHPDVRFSVVGPDDGDAGELRSFLAGTPASSRIVYEGPLRHDAAVGRLARASVYVLPSVDEPFPMTMLEAMAAGTPVIATRSNGLADRLVAADAALVVEDDNPAALAQAVDQLLADPTAAEAMGERGRALVESSFGMDAVARQLEDAYRRAIADRRRRRS